MRFAVDFVINCLASMCSVTAVVSERARGLTLLLLPDGNWTLWA